MSEVEIDTDVTMPTTTRAPQVAGDSSFEEQYDHLARVSLKITERAKQWSTRQFLVYLQPRPTSREQFGLEPILLVPQVLTFAEATDLRDHCAIEPFGEFVAQHLFVKLHELKFKVGVYGMGGYNYRFNANDYEPEQWGGTHPAGRFPARIQSCSVEPNSNENGGNLVVEFATNSGTIKKFYALWNPTPKTVEGAHKALSALCHCIGRFQIDMNDGGQALVGGECQIEVAKQKPDDPDHPYMEVKKVFLLDGSLPGKSNTGGNNQGGAPQGGGFGGGQQQPQNTNNNGNGGFGNQPQNQGQQGGFNQQQPQGGFNQGQGQPQGQPQGGFGGGQGQGQPDPNQGQGQGQGQGGFGGQQGQQGQGQPQNQGGGFGGNQGNQGGWQQQAGQQQGGPSWGGGN